MGLDQYPVASHTCSNPLTGARQCAAGGRHSNLSRPRLLRCQGVTGVSVSLLPGSTRPGGSGDCKKTFRLGANLPDAYKAWAEQLQVVDHAKTDRVCRRLPEVVKHLR